MSSQPPKTPLKACFVMLENVTPTVDTNFTAELKKVINDKNMLTTKTRRRVTEALEEIESEVNNDSRKTKKLKLLQEVITSEESYVKQLEIIKEFFIQPIQAQKLLKPEDFTIVFGNIDSIYSINKQLLDEMHQGTEFITSAFSRLAPYFKSYSSYASEYKKILHILQNCHKDNPRFAKFLEMQETRPEVHSKLSALLIAPIQRVPRYKLLLRSLFNLTPRFEHDYEALLDCLMKIEDAAEHINNVIKDQENMQRLIELQRCLQKGEPSIITPGRNLIKEGTLMRILKDGHSQKCYVVLTNDIFMCCKLKKHDIKPNSLKCSDIFPLNKSKVLEIIDKGSFRVICDNIEIVLYHEQLSETMTWVDQIKSTIRNLIDDRKTLRKESSARRPAVKRKDLGEYNEIGLSPGKRLKKKRTPYECDKEESPKKSSLINVERRRPLRLDPQYLGKYSSDNPTYDFTRTSPLFTTFKPRATSDKEQLASGSNSSENSATGRELYVFGNRANPDKGFSFRVGNWLCGLKRLFGFNDNQ